MVTIRDIESARARIASHVRHTPTVQATHIVERPYECDLWLKLESLQVTGSFKARGALNKLLSLTPDTIARGIVTASGGNHGIAVAYAGHSAHVPTTVFLPRSAPPGKADRVRQLGATVVVEGDAFDDAHAAAMLFTERTGAVYFHPFADPDVIAGQGTSALELFEDVPVIDTLLVAIGGGGLIAGAAIVARARAASIRVIGVEPVGAPTLERSVAAGRVVQLPELRTAANTLASRSTTELNLEIIREHVDRIVLVSDEEMAHAARWLWREMGIAAELSGAAAAAALLAGRVDAPASARVCAYVCGAGTAGIA